MNQLSDSISYFDYLVGFWVVTVIGVAFISTSKKNLKWWFFIPLFLAALIIGINYAAVAFIMLIVIIDVSIGKIVPVEIYQLIGTIWWCAAISLISFIAALKLEAKLNEVSE